MSRLTLLLLLTATAFAQKPFTGRWDFTVTPKAGDSKPYPDWMGVGDKVRIQPRSGSAFYAKDFKIEGTHLHIEWPSNNTTWDLDSAGGKLTGIQKRGDAVIADLAGVPAPKLDRKPPKAWTTPEPIFNGKDLTGWEPTDPNAANHWIVQNGEL